MSSMGGGPTGQRRSALPRDQGGHAKVPSLRCTTDFVLLPKQCWNFLSLSTLSNTFDCAEPVGSGLTAFLYQRDRETIAFARPDLAVSGTGSLSVAPAVGIRAKSAA